MKNYSKGGPSISVGVLMLASALLTSPPALAEKLYKWVDEKGDIHYSDKVPPQNIQQEHAQMNERGMVIKKFEASKTDEEVRQQQLEEEQKEREKQQEKRQSFHDEFLLRTYKSEEELIAIQEEQIRTLESALNTTRSNIEELKNKHQLLINQAANHERRGESVPQELIGSISQAEQDITARENILQAKTAEKDGLQAQYSKDLKRYRELRALHPVGNGNSAAP